MKKFFTLLTLALLSIGTACGTVYETYAVSLNNGVTQTPDKSTFFTVATGGGFNTKYNGKYGGTEYTAGLKINSSSSITFSTSVKSDVTIVQSTSSNSAKKFKLGGQVVDHKSGTIKIGGTDVSYSMTENTTDKYKEFVFTDVPATANLAITNSDETGMFYVKVELTEDPSAVTKLDAPEITYVAATGTVTIGAVANATKVTYTTNGSDPTASSDTYSAPFVVEDGTVVKAIAIGTGSYSSSDVTSETVYLTGITCATPTINKFNGAVAITTTTPNATIKYSLNGGAYNTYTRPFTLAVGATVKAYAERTGCTNSAEASADVTVLATNKTKTIYLDYNDFNDNDKNSATGKTGTDAEGFILAITGNSSKKWSSNGINITTPGGVKKEFKLSNGAQNTLTIPAGVHVTKFKLYSVIMSADKSLVCGWKEVGGDDYQTGDDDYKKTPMGAYNNISGYNTNPDVREYAIDQTGGTITFTNAGTQLSFVIALDILEDETKITPANDKSTYVTTAALDFSGVVGLKAYAATDATAGKVTLEEVGAVPAATPLMLVGTAGTEYTVPVAASASAPAVNLFRAGDGTTVFNGTTYDYLLYTDGLFYQIGSGTIAFDKAYLHCDSDPTGATAPYLTLDFGETTGISEELRVKSEESANAPVYNLAGQRVAQPTKGLYIVNGKKVVMK